MRAWPTPLGLARRDLDALRREAHGMTTPLWHVTLRRRGATRALLVLCAWRDARAPDRVVPVASLVFQDGRVCLVHAEGPAAYFDGTILDGDLVDLQGDADADAGADDGEGASKAPLEFWASDCARLCGRDVRWTADHATALRFAERVSADVRLVASSLRAITIRPKTCVSLADTGAVRDLARHAASTESGLAFVRTLASADARGAPHRWDAGATAALFEWLSSPPTTNVVWNRRADEGPADVLPPELRAQLRWQWPATGPISLHDSPGRPRVARPMVGADWVLAEPDAAVSKFVDFLNDDAEGPEGPEGLRVVECTITEADAEADAEAVSAPLWRQSDLWDPEFVTPRVVMLTPVRVCGRHVRHGDSSRVVLDKIRQAMDPLGLEDMESLEDRPAP